MAVPTAVSGCWLSTPDGCPHCCVCREEFSQKERLRLAEEERRKREVQVEIRFHWTHRVEAGVLTSQDEPIRVTCERHSTLGSLLTTIATVSRQPPLAVVWSQATLAVVRSQATVGTGHPGCSVVTGHCSHRSQATVVTGHCSHRPLVTGHPSL